MKRADGDDKNDRGLTTKAVLLIIGRLFGKTWHQFMDAVEKLSPDTADDKLTVTEVNRYFRSMEKNVL